MTSVRAWLLTAAGAASLAACSLVESETPAEDGGEAAGGSGGSAGSATLPAGWPGTGVLARRADAPPGAPEWTTVVAEVVDVDGKRLLRASGKSPPIKNTALARAAADNRARAELAHWLGTERLVGSELIDAWTPPGQPAFARAQIRVPPDWQPGRPLPPSWDPRALDPSAPPPPSAPGSNPP